MKSRRFLPIALLLGMGFNSWAQLMTSHAGSSAPPKPASAGPAATGKPVARVNGAVLTDRDLLREMHTIFPYAGQHKGFPREMEADIRKGALTMIIFEELVYQEAKRRNLAISEARLKQARAEFMRQFPSQADYQGYLQDQFEGSEQKLNSQIRRSLLIDDFLRAEVEQKSTVSLAEARAFYDHNPERFEYEESFAFQSISIVPPERAGAEVLREARKRAEDALRQAKATRSYQEFGLLAEKISEDNFRVNMGDHKTVGRSALPPQIVQAALAMQPGQVSDLIAIENAFTIFRLNAHILPGRQKFDDIKVKLRQQLQKDKQEKLRSEIDRKLRQSAKVEEL